MTETASTRTRYRMIIEYDGTDFHGWQIQPTSPTIQEELEKALRIVLRDSVSITGSGRTDTGVHARGQVAHFDMPASIDVGKLKHSLNGLLPGSIGILELEEVGALFHARYDARSRTYHYHLSTERHPLAAHRSYFVRPAPDYDAMNRASGLLLGTQDFMSGT